MNYKVIITEPAEAELVQAFEWWSTHRSQEQATRWYNGFYTALKSLSESPERCPVIPEADKFPIELRELYFGLGSRPTHRAIFTIRPDMVLVYTIRHLAQDQIGLEGI